MNREPLKIEELLETMQTLPVPEDSLHRYELRRTLLCSRFFDSSCDTQSRWDKFLSYTAPLVAGSMMVGVFSLLALSMSSDETSSDIHAAPSSAQIVQVKETAVFQKASLFEEFISDDSLPTVQLVDIQTFSADQLVQFIPLAGYNFVLTQ